jgi:hypothetical protein
MTVKQRKALDKEIERAYYRHGEGVTVDVMDISKIFAFCRQAVEVGEPLDTAVQAAIAIYRVKS